MFGLFKKSKQQVAESAAAIPAADETPTGEVAKVMKVKSLCLIAKMSAEALAEMSADENNEEMYAYERDRYRKYSHDAIDLARQITDKFYLDSVLHLLVDVFMVGKDEEYARRIFEVMQTDIVREKVLAAHPGLGTQL
jgi:hypothetical protein